MNKKVAIMTGIALALFGFILAVGSGHSDQYIRDRVVMLTGEDGGQCSGEQVRAHSGDDYILTAAHCRVLEKDGRINVKTEGGLTLSRAVIAEDPASDLLLLEGLPGLAGLDIAKSSHRFERVRTFTHGRGLATYETGGVLIMEKREKVFLYPAFTEEDERRCLSQIKNTVIDTFFGPACAMDVVLTASTAMTVPGSSGGVVVDALGDIVGVVSAGGGGFSFFVTLHDIQAFVKNY